jgi:hypothetical protein
MQFTDKLFQARLQIIIPGFFQTPARSVHAIKNAKLPVILENMDVPPFVV